MLKKLSLLSACFLFIFLAREVFADDKVNIKILLKEKGEINKLIYGSSILGWREDSERRLKGNTRTGGDFGYGVWDPDMREPAREVKNLALEAGIRIFRFIGMWHNWTEAINIPGYKRKFNFGADEQMRVCSETGADAVVCISYIFDNAKEAVEIVGYLNGIADNKLIGEIKALGADISRTDREKLFNQYVRNNANAAVRCANLRAINGHLDPYQVKYFEIGNETWVLGTAEKYAERYLQYYNQLKKIDPSIKIGAVFYTRQWNEKLLSIIRDKIDFGIVHIYPTPVWGKRLSAMSAKDIFSYSFILPQVEWDPYLKDAFILLEKYAGKKVPMAVTEFNGGFAQDKPLPYRHCLGTALLNAELLKIFMKPENNVLMANCWNFVNEYWGMVANGAGWRTSGLNAPYYKRPNFYTFELYNKHFGDILLDADINYGRYTYDVSEIEPVRRLRAKIKGDLLEAQVRKYNFDARVVKDGDGHRIRMPYLSVNASKSKDGKRIYIMVINKNLDESIPAVIDLKDFFSAGKADVWILNGPSIDATNEKNPNNVAVRQVTTTIKNNIFEFTFEPHSLTAIEIERR